jgi:hypothetical protein
MSKVVLTIDDGDEEGAVNTHWTFEPQLDAYTLQTPAQRLALIVMQILRKSGKVTVDDLHLPPRG